MVKVDFSLSDFDDGTVHARELLARLNDVGPRVIVLVTQPRVQRALCTAQGLESCSSDFLLTCLGLRVWRRRLGVR